MRVLIIAPYYDRNVPGESWCTFKWVEGISSRHESTVLTTHRSGWKVENSPTQVRKVVGWAHPSFTGRLARMDYELKPHYILFYVRARRWLRSAISKGFPFDVVHQINPVGMRYPSPLRGLGLKYLTGPHAGSLKTPEGFSDEGSDSQWFRKLRNLDGFRLKHDPMLKQSFGDASVVLGVAPYVREMMSRIPLKRFEIMAETGPDKLLPIAKSVKAHDSPLRLLFVGRIIRTKGVIDAIRAVKIASSKIALRFDILGTGDMMEQCAREVQQLGLADRVTLHGRVSRETVNEWYQRSDVFLFPSFREPSGTVVFEAMGFGLPLITSTIGGPGYVINESCGIRVEPKNPSQYAEELAAGIILLGQNRPLLAQMSANSLVRVNQVASWSTRLDRLDQLYNDVVTATLNKNVV